MKRELKKKKTLGWLGYSFLVWVGFALGWMLRRPPAKAPLHAHNHVKANTDAAFQEVRAARDDAMHATSKLAAMLAAKETELARLTHVHGLKMGEIATTTAQTATTMAAMKGKEDEIAALTVRVSELEAALTRKAELADQLISKQAELARLSADWSMRLKTKDDALNAQKAELERATAAARSPQVGVDWRAQLAGKESELAQARQQHNRALAELTTAAAATASALHAKDAEMDALKIQINDLNVALQTRDTELAQVKADQSAKDASLQTHQNDLSAALIRIGELETAMAMLRAGLVEPESATVPSTPPEPGTSIQRALDAGLAADVAERKAGPIDAASLSPVPVGVEAESDPTVFKLGKTFVAETAQQAGVEAVPSGHRQDLSAIDGIGPVLEQRLFKAGIYTYEALMKTSEARLAEFCNSSKRVKTPDYASWIAQAETLAAAKTNAPPDAKSKGSRKRKGK